MTGEEFLTIGAQLRAEKLRLDLAIADRRQSGQARDPELAKELRKRDAVAASERELLQRFRRDQPG